MYAKLLPCFLSTQISKVRSDINYAATAPKFRQFIAIVEDGMMSTKIVRLILLDLL